MNKTAILGKELFFVGIDPAGTTSPTAVAIISYIDDVYTVVGVHEVMPCCFVPKRITRRIIAKTVSEIINSFPNAKIIIENPMLQGKARENMYALVAVIEEYVEVDFKVAPTSVKKFFGYGRLEKDELANKILAQFKFDLKSKNLIKKLISDEKWDSTDAICIALFGTQQE